MSLIFTEVDLPKDQTVFLTMDQFIDRCDGSTRQEILSFLKATDDDEQVCVFGKDRILVLAGEEQRIYRYNPPRKNPPLGELMRNATAAIERTVKRAVTGQKVVVPTEIFHARLDVCKACKHFENGVCKTITKPNGEEEKGCGCQISAKLRLAGEQCPQGKWAVYEAGADAPA